MRHRQASLPAHALPTTAFFRLLLLFTVCILLAGKATPASSAQPAPATAENPLRVALLLEHPGGDNGWNDALLHGLERARRDLPVQTDVLVAPPQADTAALQTFFQNAATSHDMVLVASDRLHESLRNNAANFRRTMFGCIDAGIRAPNIMCITFADEQAAYLAGAAAAMLTTQTALPGINADRTIGWLSGEDVPAMRSLLNGFVEGARLVDPEVRVINKITGSFTDAESGRQAARQLLDQGADVLVLACGAGNGPAMDEAAAHGAYVVGLDNNQDNRLPGRVLTSIVKKADTAVYDLVAAAASGNFKGKEILIRDLQNGGVDITDMAPFKAAAGKNIPAGLERRLRELRGELIHGGIRLKSLREKTLCDCL
ncbi:BMP family ABC transporter substrate-binding protein [Desulfovibrio sp.]|uniref:BMP family lipoprotein n=1 Tax=Desulfovibrio sp. TaxID=885 RepID=UPI0025BE779F|nr:BMP family ABC transporter substrate-binding protein [Desulfovibrio sp.]